METANFKLDPITIEVVRHKLEGIANEMESTLLRSSFSAIVKEGQDASASLFTVHGETLAQAIAIPIHLSTLIPIVKVLIRKFPIPTMREGDIYILNDPYSGGTHLPDLALVKPVFYRRRPIALAATLTHHQDIGGLTPGSLPTNATEIFQEGFRIPPLKLYDEGERNSTLASVLRKNVRIPDVFEGDLNAQVAACVVGSRRIVDLANRYGDSALLTIFAELLDRSEKMTRDSLLTIPNGCYTYADFLDNDGIDLDRKVKITVAVTVKDGEMLCDFTGTDQQVRGPINCVPSGAQAAAFFAIRAVTDPNIPTNGGCFRPVRLITPEGSLVNPRPPAPVNARTATIKRITGCILAALRPAISSKVPADAAGELRILIFGTRIGSGINQIVGEFVAGGSGACKGHDGVDVIDTDATNGLNLPVEALESDAPIQIVRFALRKDSGGPGEYRGGLGAVREYKVISGEVVLTHRGERHFIPPKGIYKGGDGALAKGTITRADGTVYEIPSKAVTTLFPGDRLVVETPGGGGFGDPRMRVRSMVDMDLRNGKISATAAQSLYGLSSIARGS